MRVGPWRPLVRERRERMPWPLPPLEALPEMDPLEAEDHALSADHPSLVAFFWVFPFPFPINSPRIPMYSFLNGPVTIFCFIKRIPSFSPRLKSPSLRPFFCFTTNSLRPFRRRIGDRIFSVLLFVGLLCLPK